MGAVGHSLKRIREDKQLSQRKLAALSGLGRPYISQLEGGRPVSITLRTAVKLAKGLDMEPLEFIGLLLAENGNGNGSSE